MIMEAKNTFSSGIPITHAHSTTSAPTLSKLMKTTITLASFTNQFIEIGRDVGFKNKLKDVHMTLPKSLMAAERVPPVATISSITSTRSPG